MSAAEGRRTSIDFVSRSVSTRNDPLFRSGVTRSWISPFTSTATAACRSRSPMDLTTSDGRVPDATLRSEPSGSVSFSAASGVRSIITVDKAVVRFGVDGRGAALRQRESSIKPHALDDLLFARRATTTLALRESVTYPTPKTSATRFTRYVTLPLSRRRVVAYRCHARRALWCRSGLRRRLAGGAARGRTYWFEVYPRARWRCRRSRAARGRSRRGRRRVRGHRGGRARVRSI